MRSDACRSSRTRITGPLVWTLALCVAGGASGDPASSGYKREIERWRAERVKRLKSPNGWLTVAGLHWLKEGENTFGSDPSNAIVFPRGKAAPFLGTFWLRGSVVTVQLKPGVEVSHGGKPVTTMELRSDAEGQPTVLESGSLSWYVIERGDELGVRLKDSGSELRRRFRGIKNYPIDSKWRLFGSFKPYNPPKTLPITNILGIVENEKCPGAVVFERDGKTFELDVIEEAGSEEFFIVFADDTNGRATYGAGRFLYVKPPAEDGRLIIDFNKAYNPPCAFNDYTTCPLPPPQNRLPFEVTAGEKTYRRAPR